MSAVGIAVATSPTVRDRFQDHLLTPENLARIVMDCQPQQVAAVRATAYGDPFGEAAEEDETRFALVGALPPGWVLDEVRPVARSQWEVEASMSGDEREARVSIRAESLRAAIGAVATCDVVATLVERLPFDAAVEIYIGKQQVAQPE